jgi:hypothetical protein
MEIDGGLPDHVPPELLEDLWRATTAALFDAENPIALATLGDPGIREFEEMERLAGLLIWLGHAVGASVDMADRRADCDEHEFRLKRAALIAVLAFSGGSEIAETEAAESIDQVGKGDPQWLERHVSIAKQLGRLLFGEVPPQLKSAPPQVGDFIYLPTNLVRFWWISHKTRQKITALPLANIRPEKKFQTSRVKALDIEAFVQPNHFQAST